MAKRNSISNFQKECNRFFSRLTGRLGKYIYLNLPGYKECVVVSNADFEELMTYRSAMNSIHLIRPKTTFATQLKTFLKLDPSFSYVVRSNAITKCCNTYAIENAEVIRDGATGDFKILGADQVFVLANDSVDVDMYTEESSDIKKISASTLADTGDISDLFDTWDYDGLQTFSDDEIAIAGRKITEFKVIDSLLAALDIITQHTANNFENCCIHTSVDYAHIDTKTRVSSVWFRTPLLDLNTLCNSTEKYREMCICVYDGLDCPFTKEFTKTAVGQFSMTLHVYSEYPKVVQTMTVYEDDSCTIISARPYADSVVIRKISETSGE